MAVFTVFFCLAITLYLYLFPLLNLSFGWPAQSSRVFGVGCETDLKKSEVLLIQP